MKNFSGNILFLDRSDINTDEIIPARYLTEITREALAPHLLEDLDLAGFDPKRDIADKQVIITRSNFGCGSSREHAPWALEVNGINLVIAVDFARIFRQNMFNCGMMAIELPMPTIEKIFADFSGMPARIRTDFENSRFIITADGKESETTFAVSRFDHALVKAGGWVEYADLHY